MRLGPWLVIRGVVAVVFFLLLACFGLTNATPGAAEEFINKNYSIPNQNLAAASSPSRDDSSCQVSPLYPEEVRQWCSLIVENAEKNNLHPDLLAGLIWYESGGNASAYSHSGAVGLMQVMPRDGLAAKFMCINGPCFANRPSRVELENPEFNLEYGSRMLAGLYSRHQDLREALKSYGPSGAGYSYADKVLSIYERYRGD